MGKTKTVLAILNVSAHVATLLCNLFVIWLTLDWKVRKARKMFEKELVDQGMLEEDAQRIGTQYVTLKDNIMREIKSYIKIP